LGETECGKHSVAVDCLIDADCKEYHVNAINENLLIEVHFFPMSQFMHENGDDLI